MGELIVGAISKLVSLAIDAHTMNVEQALHRLDEIMLDTDAKIAQMRAGISATRDESDKALQLKFTDDTTKP